MTIQLDWPSDVVQRFAEEARRSGLSLDDYLLETVLQKKTPISPQIADDVEQRRMREDAGRRIRELRKGSVLGPDLSLRDLIEEGRRF